MFFDGDIDMVARAMVLMFGKDAPAQHGPDRRLLSGSFRSQ